MTKIFEGPTDASSKPYPFRNGDCVYLNRGSYQGTTGIFLNLRTDPKWADIREPNDVVRPHPVAWLAIVPSKS